MTEEELEEFHHLITEFVVEFTNEKIKGLLVTENDFAGTTELTEWLMDYTIKAFISGAVASNQMEYLKNARNEGQQWTELFIRKANTMPKSTQ